MPKQWLINTLFVYGLDVAYLTAGNTYSIEFYWYGKTQLYRYYLIHICIPIMKKIALNFDWNEGLEHIKYISTLSLLLS